MAKELGIGVLVRIVDPRRELPPELCAYVGHVGRITEVDEPGKLGIDINGMLMVNPARAYTVGSVCEYIGWGADFLEPLDFEAGDMEVVRDLMKPCEVETA